jgi:hypothetical protein
MGLIASELRKLTSTTTTWVMTAIGVVMVLIGAGFFLFMPEVGLGDFHGTDAQISIFVDQVGGTSFIVLVVALLSVTTEFRHGTIGRTLQITPSRTRTLVGKAVAGTLYAMGFLVIGLVAIAVLLLVRAMTEGVGLSVGPMTLTAVWYAFVGLALTAWFGVAVGALLRSQVVALTATLVWLFVLEQAFLGLAPAVGRWLPFNALSAVFMSDEVAAGMGGGPELLEPLVGLTMFLGYTLAAAVGAIVLMRKRDV